MIFVATWCPTWPVQPATGHLENSPQAMPLKRWVNESLHGSLWSSLDGEDKTLIPRFRWSFSPNFQRAWSDSFRKNGTFQSSMKQALLTTCRHSLVSASFVKFSSPGWGSRSYCENSPQWDLPLGRGTRDSSWQLVTVRDSSWQPVTLVSLGYCWCWDWVLPIVD